MRFIPSVHGFPFGNVFPDAPVVTIHVPLFGDVGVGNAAGGLCGGMTFVALDDYLAGVPVSRESSEPPAPGSPVFKRITARLIESWDAPWGILKYWGGQVASDEVLRERNGAEWAAIQSRLLRTAGAAVTLGLVRAHSHNPADLGHHHQVLGCKFLAPDRLQIYDPNFPQNDGVVISIAEDGSVHHSIDGPFRGVFETKYTTP